MNGLSARHTPAHPAGCGCGGCEGGYTARKRFRHITMRGCAVSFNAEFKGGTLNEKRAHTQSCRYAPFRSVVRGFDP